MQYEVEVGARRRQVTLAREGDAFRVTVDERVYLVDARRVSATALSLLLVDDGEAGRSLDASVASLADAGAFEVRLAGHVVPLQIRPAGARAFGRRDAAAAGVGPQRVTAPMPGKVVKVLVAPGDEVAARQGLVVVEAMKMENELRAGRPGRVRDVAVAEGQSVEAGTLLVVVE
ncbi:MAG: biotin/lipoyl-containing protein [Acidobacteriota bacterium]